MMNGANINTKHGNKSHVKTYLIKDTETGLIKIGRSENPQKRLFSLQCGNTNKLKLIHIIDANIEQKLHYKFAHKRVRGEWFSVELGEVVSHVESMDLSACQVSTKEVKERKEKIGQAVAVALDNLREDQNSCFDDYGFQCEWVPELMRYRDSGQPYFEIEYQKNPLIKREYEMIYMIIFGKTEAMIRISLGVHDYDNFGPSLPKSVFDVVRSLQRANTVYIEDGLDFNERKEKLTSIYNRKHKQKIINEIHLLNA